MGEHYKNWRLCLAEDDGGVSDEMIARLQGAVTQNGLVPENAHTCGQRKAMFLSQQIEISGLGTATFEKAITMLPVISDRFEQHLSGADMRSGVAPDSHAGNTFRASSRLFTARYYKRVEHKGSSTVSYEETVPGAFKTGDLIELQVSFVAIKAAANKVKITTRLQAITLLSNEYSKSASQGRIAARATVANNVSVRRRVGYFQEDDKAERKVKRRRVDMEEGAEEMTQ
ncbi:hypothetical protein B0H17DRAFT_1130439 [Mycena rosella]|uniref:Uncharacterized protein n=1 Tax=Mycena rosella TaxID=1033263 RepID=A0AAD7DQQ7_MYCRO|nr:hypothetical protein B0H17DRAFT_1130439 [Mycena rosella]